MEAIRHGQRVAGLTKHQLSRILYMDGREPLGPSAAKRLFQRILEWGEVEFTVHALAEMAADGLDRADVESTIRGGVVDPPEWEGGEWRYRVRTRRVETILALEDDDVLVIVTAWRLKS